MFSGVSLYVIWYLKHHYSKKKGKKLYKKDLILCSLSPRNRINFSKQICDAYIAYKKILFKYIKSKLCFNFFKLKFQNQLI